MDTNPITSVAYLYKDGPITIVINNAEVHTIEEDHINYSEVWQKLQDEDWDGLRELINVSKTIENFSEGYVQIEGGVLSYRGELLNNHIAERIVRMYSEGNNITPMVNFLNNLMENPSKRSVDELYGFLEYGNLPLTPDGCFLAYKVVRNNYFDKHSGTFDNSVGSICEMPRNFVNDNKEETCSTGLHFCSREYAEGFFGNSGDRMMVIKINPRDVVSIPVDYNNTKGRCSRYEVVGELPFENAKIKEEDYLEDSGVVNEKYYTQEDLDDAHQQGYDEGYADASDYSYEY